jgi:hypothetical protein
MSLPYEHQVLAEIANEHEATMNEMRDVLRAAVGLVEEKSLQITKVRGSDRHVLAVALALYTKACKTHRAIQNLCGSGLTSDADALLRVLFETTVALHFILKRQSTFRSRMYGLFSTVQTVKAAREWIRTKGMKRFGRQLTKAAEKEFRQMVERFAPRLARMPVNHTFGPVVVLAAVTWRKAQTEAEREVALNDLAVAVYNALKKHWSGQSLEAAADGVGLSQAYKSIYRLSSRATHAADFDSHLGLPSGEGEIVLNLIP